MAIITEIQRTMCEDQLEQFKTRLVLRMMGMCTTNLWYKLQNYWELLEGENGQNGEDGKEGGGNNEKCFVWDLRQGRIYSQRGPCSEKNVGAPII